MLLDLFKAFVLGVIEGLTEFLPVSSTGHLLLVQRFFGFDDDDFGKTFAVLIQFGASGPPCGRNNFRGVMKSLLNDSTDTVGFLKGRSRRQR